MRAVRVRGRVLVLALALALLESCALTSKAPTVDVRYFTPEVAVSRDRAEQVVSSAQREARPPPRLCLGHVTSSNFLRSHIVYRVSPYEVGSHEDLRWTEYPEVYLRRALRRSLFDDARLLEAATGACPTLDVDLLGFEEVRRGDARGGRVQIAYRLREGSTVLASDVVTIERAADAGAGMAAIVAAIGGALDEATVRLSLLVAERLSAAPEAAR